MKSTNTKTSGIGVDDFKEVIKHDYYYVDKTNLIEKIIESGAKVTLFTRPRRFGKSLNLSMLKYFFEMDYEAYIAAENCGENVANHQMPVSRETLELFQGLDIMNAGEAYSSHMRQDIGRY